MKARVDALEREITLREEEAAHTLTLLDDRDAECEAMAEHIAELEEQLRGALHAAS